jgi:type III secretion system (T3SS) chaperone YscW
VSPVVSGRVTIHASVAPFRAGVLHARVEDVSYADRAAPLVGETVIEGVRHEPDDARDGGTVVPFRITLSAPVDPEHDYAVRVWIDTDGDGTPGAGDVWSDQAYPVLTRGFGSNVVVALGKA